MEYDGITTKFKPELLDGLLNDENSCVEVFKKHKEHVTLLPYHLINLKESLTSFLDLGISKYSKKYNGVLLAHKNIKVLPSKSVVNREYVYIHMDIEADFFIFKPEINKVLNGVVNKFSPRHVGVLIYNTFNVSIPKPKSDANWLGEQVNIGQEVVLRINFINYECRLPHIRAEIISIKENQSNKSTKIKFDTDSEPDDSQVKVKKKKKKKSKDLCEESVNNDVVEDSSMAELNFIDENGAEEVESSKKHKRKREKSSQKNGLDTASTENDENVTKKKKRRSKGNNSLEDEGNISGIKLEKSLDEDDLDLTENKGVMKKKKKKEHSIIQQDLNYENNNDVSEETFDRRVKKPKKIKVEDSSTAEFNFIDENGAEEVESSKKHKRKLEKSSQKDGLDTVSTENDENVTKKKKRRSKGNNLLEDEGNISGIMKLEKSLDEDNLDLTENKEGVMKKKKKKEHSVIQQDLNYENDQNLKKNKMKRRKSCHELEENNFENATGKDGFSYDFDKPLNLENLIDGKNISAMSNNICSVDYNIKKICNERSSSTGIDSSMVNLKKEILYDSEVENMMKDFGFNSGTETTKKRKRSSIVNYDIEDVKSKKIKTEP